VLIQPSFFGTNNAEMLATIASDPSRLRGVAVVDPEIAEAQLARLHAGGVRAIRMNLRGIANLSSYSAENWTPLFARVHALGWHVETFLDAGALPGILPLFAQSNIAVTLDHFGSPGETAEAIDATFAAAKALATGRDVWCKFSAPYRLGGVDPTRLAQRWLALVGPERVVWGSDWPWTQHERGMDYQRLREGLDRWAGAAAAPAILWDNAARLYGFA
jgi:predicted TIM-barrel fold metal-dependent hydrolase